MKNLIDATVKKDFACQTNLISYDEDRREFQSTFNIDSFDMILTKIPKDRLNIATLSKITELLLDEAASKASDDLMDLQDITSDSGYAGSTCNDNHRFNDVMSNYIASCESSLKRFEIECCNHLSRRQSNYLKIFFNYYRRRIFWCGIFFKFIAFYRCLTLK